MAYTRWSDGDLYIIRDKDSLVCICCKLMQPGNNAITCRHSSMIAHVGVHLGAGHTAHRDTVRRLQADHRCAGKDLIAVRYGVERQPETIRPDGSVTIAREPSAPQEDEG